LPPACCSRCCIACSKYGTGRTCSNQVGAVQRVHSRMPSCMQEKLCYSRLPCELADSLTRQVHLAAGTQDVYASLTHLLWIRLVHLCQQVLDLQCELLSLSLMRQSHPVVRVIACRSIGASSCMLVLRNKRQWSTVCVVDQEALAAGTRGQLIDSDHQVWCVHVLNTLLSLRNPQSTASAWLQPLAVLACGSLMLWLFHHTTNSIAHLSLGSAASQWQTPGTFCTGHTLPRSCTG